MRLQTQVESWTGLKEVTEVGGESDFEALEVSTMTPSLVIENYYGTIHADDFWKKLSTDASLLGDQAEASLELATNLIIKVIFISIASHWSLIYPVMNSELVRLTAATIKLLGRYNLVPSSCNCCILSLLKAWKTILGAGAPKKLTVVQLQVCSISMCFQSTMRSLLVHFSNSALVTRIQSELIFR